MSHKAPAPRWAQDIADELYSRLGDIERKINIIGRLSIHSNRKENAIMSKISDANAQLDAILTSTAEETDILQSIATGVDGIKAQNLDLAQQLADAIAGGANSAEVEALVAKIQALNNAVDGQKLAENAIKNTLADTGTPPSPPVGP